MKVARLAWAMVGVVALSLGSASVAEAAPSANKSANVATATSQTAEDYYYGCPPGAVCIYARDDSPGWVDPDPNKITNIYWSYGAHNLSNQLGKHWLVNNQVPRGSNAWVSTCTGYNGVNCTKQILPYMGIRLNFDPINSIVLHRP